MIPHSPDGFRWLLIAFYAQILAALNGAGLG
jgi:hypothetical protein